MLCPGALCEIAVLLIQLAVHAWLARSRHDTSDLSSAAGQTGSKRPLLGLFRVHCRPATLPSWRVHEVELLHVTAIVMMRASEGIFVGRCVASGAAASDSLLYERRRGLHGLKKTEKASWRPITGVVPGAGLNCRGVAPAICDESRPR